MAAGLGFKTFTTGEVLTAADTNGYLMQGVLVFASAAARDAAITSPQEGQCCYLKDTDAVLTYSGAAWVGFDDSNAIQNTIVDAKGDLIGATAADTPARLAVGTNGQVLTADSTAATGLAWATASSGSTNVAGKNAVLNSNFSIFQRGTTTTLTSTSFVSDRWQAIRAVAGATATRQVTGDTTNLPFIQYCLRVARDSGNTSTSVISMGQNFESLNSIPFAGKTVTMSFYARAGANYSAASSVLNTYLTSGTGTDQNNVTGAFTSPTQVVNSNAVLTTTWQRFTYSGTVASTATQLGVQWQFTPVGTAGANDYYEITGVQVEIAASATTYSPCTATYASELAACQRYYYRLGGATYASLGNAVMTSATIAQSYVGFPQLMRTSPTINTTGTAGDYRVAAASAFTCTSVPVLTDATFTSPSGCTVQYASSGMTGGSGAYVNLINNINAFLAFSAEL